MATLPSTAAPAMRAVTKTHENTSERVLRMIPPPAGSPVPVLLTRLAASGVSLVTALLRLRDGVDPSSRTEALKCPHLHRGFHEQRTFGGGDMAAEKPRVLFLCAHNAARSQMAEALLR